MPGDDSLARIGERTGGKRVRLATNGPSGVAVGAGAVWATAPYDGVLWRVDPDPRLVERTIPVGIGASAVHGGRRCRVGDERLARNRVPDRSLHPPGRAHDRAPRHAAQYRRRSGKALGQRRGRSSTPVANGAEGGIDALPAETCGHVFYGGGRRPDVLIVSDMPLRGGPRLPTHQMAQAIACVLRQRGFRAGRFRVGYQYAAAAAATLLDAIAASDGSRSSVIRELFATRLRRGIVAPLRFDADGDVLPSPITIVRARRGGGDDTVESIDGAAIKRVVRPPRSLTR